MLKLPKWFAGSSKLVGPLNRMLNNIQERTPLRSASYDIEAIAGQGWRLKLSPSVGGGSDVAQFRVEAVFKNHLLCKPVTLADNGVRTVPSDAAVLLPHLDKTIVRIAKLDELRVMGWDSNERVIAGLTPDIDGYQYDYDSNGVHPDEIQRPWNKRTSTLLDGSEFLADEIVNTDEEIWPEYIARQTVIYAAKLKSAIFTVTEQVLGGTPPTLDYAIQWIDLSARQFVPRFNKFKVCNPAGAGTRWVNIRSSDAYQEST